MNVDVKKCMQLSFAMSIRKQIYFSVLQLRKASPQTASKLDSQKAKADSAFCLMRPTLAASPIHIALIPCY